MKEKMMTELESMASLASRKLDERTALRDQIAMEVMKNLATERAFNDVVSRGGSVALIDAISLFSYGMADAMLKARDQYDQNEN